jgi:CRP-like cAMP-binding protein
MQSVESLIRDAPVFHDLQPEQLELVAGCASNARFNGDDVLFREGDPADTFYLVRQGTVAIEVFDATHGSKPIETIEAGEVIGWSWLFPPYRWHFDARALTLVRATAFDGACLRRKCEEDPAFGYQLMTRFAQVMIQRLQWTRLRLLDVYAR